MKKANTQHCFFAGHAINARHKMNTLNIQYYIKFRKSVRIKAQIKMAFLHVERFMVCAALQ